MDKQREPYSPLQLRVRKLEKGMALSGAIYSHDGCVLLPQGTQPSAQDIDRLNRWDQRYLYVERQEDQEKPNPGRVHFRILTTEIGSRILFAYPLVVLGSSQKSIYVRFLGGCRTKPGR